MPSFRYRCLAIGFCRIALGAYPLWAAQAAGAQGAISERAATGTTEWYEAPCLTDSVDAAEWTLYEMRGIRVRVPAEFKRIKVPVVDELHFRRGRAQMQLRVRLDASSLFKEYYTPQRTYRYCQGELGGRMVEAISFREGTAFGFSARWPDADRGEWLSVVIIAPTLREATALRRALFTLELNVVRD